MRIACILVPHFAVAVERRRDPALGDRPVVVYQGTKVVDAAQEAAGIRPDLSLQQAKALCPHAVYLPANDAHYRSVAESALAAVETVAPLVEPAGPGCCYADSAGLEGHYADEFALAGALVRAVRDATGLLPSAGIASGKFVAWVAAGAVASGDAGVVPAGREQAFLQDKDVSLLLLRSAQDKLLGPDVIERLDLLALRTLGDIAALPRPAVEAQFRRSGGRLWELANGIDREPLRPRKQQEVLTERLSFAAPVIATEALIAAGRQLIARLARRLRGRTARHLRIQLLADERIVWERRETFREPTGDERRMLLLLKTRLSFLELPQMVETVVLTLSGIGQEIAKQAKLFTETQQNLNQLADAVRQLRARYGRPVVHRIVEVDPWSRHPEERSVLVPYDA
jgi:nucleotidyltransferase/DNA polymerase involved in DNA repair